MTVAERKEDRSSKRKELQNWVKQQIQHIIDGIQDQGIDIVYAPIRLKVSESIDDKLLTVEVTIKSE
jgi:hypothetical protein